MMNRSFFPVEANANGNILAETMKKEKKKEERNDTVKQLKVCVMCSLRAGAFVQAPRRNR